MSKWWFHALLVACNVAIWLLIAHSAGYHDGWQTGFHLRDDDYQRGLDMGHAIWSRDR